LFSYTKKDKVFFEIHVRTAAGQEKKVRHDKLKRHKNVCGK